MHGLTKFSIQERINDMSNTLGFEYSSSVGIPEHFIYKNDMGFVLYDTKQPDGFVTVQGKALEIEPDYSEGDTYFKVTGRTDGDILNNQPFNLNCVDGGDSSHTTEELLKLILQDTSIKVARNQKGFDSSISYNNDSQNANRFCGTFNTKKEALDELFKKYGKLSGANKIRWFIDIAGNLRWFELRGNRERPIIISLNDENILSFTPSRDCSNIKNDITVRGGKDSEIVAHVEDKASIDGYYNNKGIWVEGWGRRIEEISDSDLTTQEEVNKRANEELMQKKGPIYTVIIDYDGYYSGMVGDTYRFKDNDFVKGLIFTLVEKNVNGNPADWKTSLQFTTDESSNSIPNMFETINAISKTNSNAIKSEEAIVTSTPEQSSGDSRITVLMLRTNTTESVKYVERASD